MRLGVDEVDAEVGPDVTIAAWVMTPPLLEDACLW